MMSVSSANHVNDEVSAVLHECSGVSCAVCSALEGKPSMDAEDETVENSFAKGNDKCELEKVNASSGTEKVPVTITSNDNNSTTVVLPAANDNTVFTAKVAGNSGAIKKRLDADASKKAKVKIDGGGILQSNSIHSNKIYKEQLTRASGTTVISTNTKRTTVPPTTKLRKSVDTISSRSKSFKGKGLEGGEVMPVVTSAKSRKKKDTNSKPGKKFEQHTARLSKHNRTVSDTDSSLLSTSSTSETGEQIESIQEDSIMENRSKNLDGTEEEGDSDDNHIANHRIHKKERRKSKKMKTCTWYLFKDPAEDIFSVRNKYTSDGRAYLSNRTSREFPNQIQALQFEDGSIHTSNLLFNDKLDVQQKKKGSFQITGVVTACSGQNTIENEGEMEDVDEAHGEDITLSSDLQDISRTNDLDQEPLTSEATTPKEMVKSPQVADIQSRFRVVKIESKEPFQRGRWTCLDFLDPPLEKATESLENVVDIGSDHSSSAGSVHFMTGTDELGNHPLGGMIIQVGGYPIVLPKPIYNFNSYPRDIDLSRSLSPVLMSSPVNVTKQDEDGGESEGLSEASESSSESELGDVDVQPVKNVVAPNDLGGSNADGAKLQPKLFSRTPSEELIAPFLENNEETLPAKNVPCSGNVSGGSEERKDFDNGAVSSQHQPQQQGSAALQQKSNSNTQRKEEQSSLQQTKIQIDSVLDPCPSSSDLELDPVPANTFTEGTVSDDKKISDTKIEVDKKSQVLQDIGEQPFPTVITDKKPQRSTVETVSAGSSAEQYLSTSPSRSIENKLPENKNPTFRLEKPLESFLTPPLLEMVSATMGSTLTDPDCNQRGATKIAIDHKIEQAMDLVKSHLMFAVREEVEFLKEQVRDLVDKNKKLEYENGILKANASSDTLAKIKNQPAFTDDGGSRELRPEEEKDREESRIIEANSQIGQLALSLGNAQISADGKSLILKTCTQRSVPNTQPGLSSVIIPIGTEERVQTENSARRLPTDGTIDELASAEHVFKPLKPDVHTVTDHTKIEEEKNSESGAATDFLPPPAADEPDSE